MDQFFAVVENKFGKFNWKSGAVGVISFGEFSVKAYSGLVPGTARMSVDSDDGTKTYFVTFGPELSKELYDEWAENGLEKVDMKTFMQKVAEVS